MKKKYAYHFTILEKYNFTFYNDELPLFHILQTPNSVKYLKLVHVKFFSGKRRISHFMMIVSHFTLTDVILHILQFFHQKTKFLTVTLNVSQLFQLLVEKCKQEF